MRNKHLFLSSIIIFLTFVSLGCTEYSNQLSSDLTSVGKNTISTMDDSNLIITYKCEQQKELFVYDKFTIIGDITNIGNKTIYCNVSVSFYTKNNQPWGENQVSKKINIEPNETSNFELEMKFEGITNRIKNYKIDILYSYFI